MASDFLQLLHATVQRLQAASSTDSVDVAYLGNVLRKDGYNWAVHGFGRLSEALEQLQQERHVEVFRNEKSALQVRAVALGGPGTVPQVLASRVQGARFRPLRPPVWFAFTAPLPSGQQRLINRGTGAVWRDASVPPASRADWVPVVPVADDEQRRWAREFLENIEIGNSDKDALLNAVQSADWFRQFPASLDERRRRDWNRLRSERVIGYVKSWAREQDIAEDALFAAEGSFLSKLNEPPVVPTELRRALLATISKMSTDELLALPMQARLLIEVIRPDLLKANSSS